MASVNRSTLPQNFLDTTSRGMRLIQPEPQYFFAQAAGAGSLVSGALDAGAATIQQFISMAGGGDVIPPQLERLARAGDMYPGAVKVINEFGKNKGDTVKMHRPVYAGGGYTLDARRTTVDKSTSTTGIAIQSEEVPMVLGEFEGPYSVLNSAVQPYAIRDFDAKFRANREQLTSLVSMHLVRDYTKWLDTVIRDLLRSTSNVTYDSTGTAAASSYASGGTGFINLDAILRARKALSDREWSPFPNGRYICCVPTAFNVQMVGDPDWRQLSAFQSAGKNQLFGYIGSVQDVDIFEVSTLKAYAAGEVVPNDGTTVAAGVTLQEALLFGPDTIGLGTGMPPTAFFADDTNYGKEAKVIWRAYQAFQTLDNRGIQRILFQS